MNLSGNTILITGGASGIGYALAERFLKAGSEIILVGRRADKLAEAKAKQPKFHTHVADIATPEGRVALRDWAIRQFPKVNSLVNNAGIQRRIALTEPEPWEVMRQEISTNLEAPIHLTSLFLTHLQKQPKSYLLNVTSGLAFSPLANVPVYSATKAALRSFTLSLRHQLEGTSVEVIEVIPPAVDTDLGGPGLHTFGVNVDDFAESIIQALAKGEQEVAFGMSEKSRHASAAELRETFARMNHK